MIIHILAGGPVDHHPSFEIYEDVVWVAVDRGVYHLLKKGIQPFIVFGDFDSVTAEELAWMQERTPLHMFPKEKDETDLEIAIQWALSQKPQCIRIFGATGGRLDHGLANIQMLVKQLSHEVEMEIIDHKNEITLKKAGAYEIGRKEKYPYVSFIPLTETVTGITLKGFKYPLFEKTIQWGSTLCISNELVAEKGTFSFQNGILMVIRSTD